MFEISQLKEKKLPELQELAKELNVPKFKSLKKIDLVYQILDLQAANPTIVTPEAPAKPPKPKRERISKPTKESNSKPETNPVVKAAPKRETNSENKLLDSKVETKETAKTETKSDTKMESKVESKNNPRAQKQNNPNQKIENLKNPNNNNKILKQI